MELTPEMFRGRKLGLWMSARGYDHVDVDMLPEEAIELLVRLEGFRRRARSDERLLSETLGDRDYRIGWELRAQDVKLLIQSDGIAWRFQVETESGTETIETRVLKRDDLLTALLKRAHPEAFRLEFREVARISAEVALDALEEWLELDARQPGRTTIIPVTAEDVSTILSNAEDPDVRERAMSALARLEREDDDVRSDAA